MNTSFARTISTNYRAPAPQQSWIERLAAWADRQPPRSHPASRWISLRMNAGQH